MSNDNKQSIAVGEGNAGDVEEPVVVSNRFTPDAQDRVARLRAMAAEFPDEKDPRALTPAEIRIARVTTTAALERQRCSPRRLRA